MKYMNIFLTRMHNYVIQLVVLQIKLFFYYGMRATKHGLRQMAPQYFYFTFKHNLINQKIVIDIYYRISDVHVNLNILHL